MSMLDKGVVLIVDDESNAIKVLSAILENSGYSVLHALNVDNAIKIIKQHTIDAIISDIKMPGKDGYDFFEHVSEHYPDIPLIFLTAYGSVESAVNAITDGAFYYFVKPPDYVKLKSILSRAVEERRLKNQLQAMKNREHSEFSVNLIIGDTPQMRKILKTIDSIKDSESSIFIHGETGTGKEVMAKKLHFSSNRSDKPFVAFNCAAMPRELIESELFGYEKGAFTGAVSQRVGKFEEASGGTILLDEIGELELPMQAKLLRVLQEKEIERLGSNKKIKVDFRLISTTNRILQEDIEAGRFRKDLYYRINVVRIHVPPLRDRREDIPLFASAFLKEFCARENKILTISYEIMESLVRYSWPGNIRQLRNVIERAVVLSKGKTIDFTAIPEDIVSTTDKPDIPAKVKSLKDVEYSMILHTLQACNGNKSMAAKRLGISRKALYKRLKDFAIPPSPDTSAVKPWSYE